MSSPKNKPPLGLDMDFSEALQRFSKVDPMELSEELRPIRLKKEGKSKKPNPID